MFYGYVFHQDPTTSRYTSRRKGAPSDNLQSVIRAVEKSGNEGYVIKLGQKKPVWNNVKNILAYK